MESRVNYTLVGAFVLFLGITLVTVIIWLAFGLSDKKYQIYKAYLHESVTGLSVNATVKYNGVNVGYVKKITLNQTNPNQVNLTLAIEERTPVKEDTRATLMSQGLTGVSFINLTGGSIHSPRLQTRPGQKYPVIHTAPSLLLRLDMTVRELSDSLGKVSNNLEGFLDADNRAMVKRVLQNMEHLSHTLAANSAQIDQSMKSLTLVLDNGAKASQHLPELIEHLKQSSLAVTKMSHQLAQTGTNSSQALQLLTEQTLPQAMQALSSIQTVSERLKTLTDDLQQNPSMLIRGRQTAQLGPGE